MGELKKFKKFISYVLASSLLFVGGSFFIATSSYATPLVCNMHTITGDDDGSFQMLLPFYLKLGPTEYDRVYYSTNATVTFGQPDGTFWDYPQTPSVSIAGRDWVSFGPGAYTSYGYNENSFCIEWSVRPFPQSSGPLTQMRLVVNKFSNGNWHGEIITMTDLPADARRGIRYERNQPIVSIEAAFDVGDGGIPIEVEPQPTPSSFTEPPVIPSESPTPTPEPSPTASPEPQPSESPTPTEEPSPQPSEPSPQPSEPVVQPSETSSPSPTPSLSPSESPWQPEEPVVVPSLAPEPEISFPEPEVLIPDESPSPDPDLPSTDLPSDNNITETTDEETASFVEDFTASGSISDAETELLIENFLNDGFISEDEVSGLSDSLTEDGVLTEDEKELLVDVILEQADGNAISTELIDELGLDYEDLPDDQPIMLDNGVILFAEVADALEIWENPSEILGAVFTDPGKALTAVANIGADMTPEQRKESQTIVVASIIVGQVISTTNLITGRIR
ncbi:hypothetical protein UFOVP359_139 [uncultured Caudovirales phage]|uniref:Uncharacterized protein n=1 Tax=uncultured Caudovirales phage TaxID=2100421 RepID=A0A6J7WYJ2_9CAUD|nr:hypothetical protein UFOVP359_139 [uncultured Caudovirales phage]